MSVRSCTPSDLVFTQRLPQSHPSPNTNLQWQLNLYFSPSHSEVRTCIRPLE
jgi:hypothetical protein